MDEKAGHGVLIYFPNLGSDPERSKAIVPVERKSAMDGESDTRFEKAKFADFPLNSRPSIEIVGVLYANLARPEECSN